MKAVLSFFFILVFGLTGCSPGKKEEIQIALQPFKGAGKDHIILVKKALEKYYHTKVTVLKEKDLPPNAYYSPLNKYQTDTLLDYLKSNKPSGFYKIIGITDKDIATTKNDIPYYGIFGIALLEGESCIISSCRLKRNSKKSADLNLRLSKVALHELGHTLGLEHCTKSEKCFMHSAEGKLSTVDKTELKLCESCAGALKDYIR